MSYQIGKTIRWLSVMALATVGFGQTGWADEVAELKQHFEALQQQVNAQNAELATLRQQVKQLGAKEPAGAEAPAKSMTDRVAALEQGAEKQAKALGDFTKIKWSGDFRLRFYDGIFNQDATSNRHRARVRFRYGATYPITDQLEFGARLATGGSDGDTANVTLGDLFAKDSFDLDRYYVRYKPLEGLDLVGGKFENPFWVSEATWDVDLQPEGFAGSYTFKELAGLLDSATVRSGLYTVSEVAADHDAYLVANQAVLSKKLAEDWKFETGLAHYNLHKASVLSIPTGTNATDASGNYLSEFKVLDHLTRLTYEGWPQPVSLLFDYGHNFGSNSGLGDNLYRIETNVGKIKDLWDWQLTYYYTRIEQDATVAAFAGNLTTPETNMSQHALFAFLRVLKNTDLGLRYHAFKQNKVGRTASTDEENWLSRFQMEVATKF